MQKKPIDTHLLHIFHCSILQILKIKYNCKEVNNFKFNFKAYF